MSQSIVHMIHENGEISMIFSWIMSNIYPWNEISWICWLFNSFHIVHFISGPVSDRTIECCETCNQNAANCKGHFGYIELPVTVFNPVLLDLVASILNLICYQCGTLFMKSKSLHFHLWDKALKIWFKVSLGNWTWNILGIILGT